jgi:electron transfer flavoprotein alpha subunit
MGKILVIAEHANGRLADSTRNTLSAASVFAFPIDVLLASHEDTLIGEIAQLDKVDTVKYSEHPRFSNILAEDIAPLIVRLAK